MNAPITPDDKLAIAAAKLKRASPATWEEFMDAVRTITDDRTRDVVRAPADKVFVAQGRAQQCGDLLQTLTDALKIADRLSSAKPK